jgi:Phage integrase family.
MRYTSRIDAGVLMRQAREELAESDPDSFLAMLLALAAGLRRGEIDRLLWRNVDFARGRIIIEESEHGQLKTEESRGPWILTRARWKFSAAFRRKRRANS